MKNGKLVQLTRHALSKIEAFERECYADYDYVVCFDAVHTDVYGDESAIYTWYVPAKYKGLLPAPGLQVEVENLDETAVVTVVSHTYTKTKNEHLEDIHPYCAMIRVIVED